MGGEGAGEGREEDEGAVKGGIWGGESRASYEEFRG